MTTHPEAAPARAELIEARPNLTDRVKLLRIGPWANYAEVPDLILQEIISALAAKDKRIAELEGQRDAAHEANRALHRRVQRAEGDVATHRAVVADAKETQGGIHKAFMWAYDYYQSGLKRIAELESALSLAESRGRQIGHEEAAKVAENMREVIPMWERPGGPPGNGPKRPATPSEIAAAIRNLPTNKGAI